MPHSFLLVLILILVVALILILIPPPSRGKTGSETRPRPSGNCCPSSCSTAASCPRLREIRSKGSSRYDSLASARLENDCVGRRQAPCASKRCQRGTAKKRAHHTAQGRRAEGLTRHGGRRRLTKEIARFWHEVTCGLVCAGLRTYFGGRAAQSKGGTHWSLRLVAAGPLSASIMR